MAGTLGSLVLKLSADVATLQGDLGKAASSSQQYADRVSKQWADTAHSIKDGFKDLAGGIVAAFSVEKLVEFGKQAIETADQMTKMAQKVGVSVESLSALSVQAKLSGGGLDELGSGMEKLARNAAAAAGGSKEQAAAFQAIGVAVKDANGNVRQQQDILTDLAKKFSGYADGVTKTADAQIFFGKAGAQLIPVLNELGEKGFDEVTKSAQAFGQVISTETAKQAEHFNDNLTSLGLEAKGLANSVVANLLPALNQLSDSWVEAGKTTNNYADSANTIASAVKILIFGLLAVKETIAAAVASFAGMYDTVKATFSAAGDIVDAWATATAAQIKAALHFDPAGVDAAQAQFSAKVKTIGETFSKSIEGAKAGMGGGLDDLIKNVTADWNILFAAQTKAADSANKAGEANKGTAAPLIANTAALDEAKKAAEQLADMLTKDAETLAKLRGALDPLSKAQQEYVQRIIEIQAAYSKETELAKTAGASLERYAQIKQLMIDKTAAAQAAYGKEATAIAKAGDVLGNYLKQAAKENALIGLTDREKAIAQAVQNVTDEFEKNTEKGIKNAQSLHDVAAGASAAAAATFDLEKTANDVKDFVKEFGDVSPFEKLTKGIEEVGKALEKAMGEGATDRIKELQKTLGGIRQSLVEGIVKSSQDGLRSLQSMSTEGSNAFKVMQVAIDALTLVQAVSAILNQAQGDPYSAFARMAAMAAAVVALGVDIAGFGGGGGPSAQSSEQMQKTQGTGTVLGDATAQSDSIAKAIEITANATTQLVGLNRGMLNALNNLQDGLGAAGGQIARGENNVPAPSLSGGLDIPGDPLGSKIFGALFGGKQKIIDAGITIAGGVLSDMINSIAVGAYTTIHTSGGLFGHGKDSQVVTDITDQFGKQFSLVIKSIADTVKQGALALGLLPADVQKALDDYQVAAINISLQGLSADDQQKALEAVFSSIFDGVAAAVVPFIGQFQEVGEGLGETLVRIATEVQVAQEGFKQLGLSVSQTDPEKFAQISDALIKAAGGIDDFISGMQSFVDNFSSDSNKLAISGASIASAFSQVGLTVPATRDGMWGLMQSLDATTDAGRAQIATLLRLSDASAAYYDQIDAFNKTLGIGQESDLHAQLKSIRDAATGLVKALTAAGASSDTLQKIYTAATEKVQEVIAALQESAQELAFSLGLTTQGSLDQVNQEISSLESKANGGASAVSNFGSAIHEASQKANDAINLLLGNLSPLNDQQKLQTALNGLRAGTVTADQVLEIGRRLYASSEAYTSLFNTVKGYTGKGGTTGGSSFSGGNSSTSSGGGLTSEEQTRLQQLLAQQQTLQAAQTLSQYQTLAQQIAEIASAKQESWQDVLKEMSIQSSDLEKGLGLANDDALDAYLTNIQKQTDSATESAQSIVDAILALPTQIAAALSGALPAGGSTGPNHVTIPTIGGSTPSTPPGTGNNGTTPVGGSGGNGAGGNGGGTGPIHLSPESATMVGNAVVIGMQPTVNGIMNLPSRNLRIPASVR